MFRRRKHREEDLERELQSHLEHEAEEQRENGATDREARSAARRELGNLALIQEDTRTAWGYGWRDRLVQDLRFGLRSLARNPGFAAVAILAAALGIGANTAIFSIVNAVLLRPLPYPDAGRLVAPMVVGKDTLIGMGVADFQYAAWREQARVFAGIAAYFPQRFTITGEGDAEELRGAAVTPGFLRTLGMAPLLGRDLTAGDAGRRGGTVALLTYSLWARRLHADSAILSKTILLNGKQYTIAGVLPRDFEFPANSAADVLVAMTEPRPQPGNGTYFYNVIARLKPQATTARAESDLELINRGLAAAYPGHFDSRRAGTRTQVLTLHDRLVGDVRPAVLVLWGAVGLVLLIVCVNICNLLLARAVARQKEIAVRMALGAARARVFRQLLTEGMLLAGVGGMAGLGVAFAGARFLRAIAPADVPHVEAAHISAAALAFTIGMAVLTGLVFGLAPLRAASAIDPEEALKQTGRAATRGRGQRRTESLLVVSEIAFALVLLAGAGLLMRTMARLAAIPPGFQPDHVLTATVKVPYWKYRTAERQRAVLDALLEKVRSGPGVEAAGEVACPPYAGFVMTSSAEIEGKPLDPARADGVAVNFAAGDYFRAMGIPILEGRALNSADAAGRPAVTVVNQVFAHRFFAGGSPLGARIRIQGVTGWLEVVGVSGNVEQSSRSLAAEIRPEIFQPAAQSESGGSAQTLVVRTAGDPRGLERWLAGRIGETDRDLPPPEIRTMREAMAELVASQVFVLRLLGLFAAIAVTLAAIGIYSVLAYSVAQRRHEVGIRLALGARPAQVAGLILGRALGLSAAGALIGIAGSLALTRYLDSLLYGVTARDPATLAAGCAVLVAAALAAAWLPARRAARQDPAATLRAE